MGVPAFYRWLTEKYPKITLDVLEERIQIDPCTGGPLPFNATTPNPSGLECDNLYIDMNGIIHPCSHPENGPQPKTEQEMYENVCRYVDRLVYAVRPRKLLYLAIDGVAPRAKMNQQRARRFRSAQEARELKELESHIQENLPDDEKVPLAKDPWDSNVITPGTPFMLQLADFVRFYIRRRFAEDPAWKNLRVIFSDASIPGEGEHKIMNHVRLQRAQPSYNPNTVHVLHGLDADLIMLALATHEAHFYICREQVLFGRKSREMEEERQQNSGFTHKQQALNDVAGPIAMQLTANQHKPLQMVSIPILREYLAFEFFEPCLNPARLSFQPDLERLIDDIIFLCFFVALDIRDGALDFLFNVYKRVLPGIGDYITSSGGTVNLSAVDVLLAEVGAIENHVFQMRHENEEREKSRRNRNRRGGGQRHPPPPAPTGKGRAARILAKEESEAPHKLGKKGGIQVSHMSPKANAMAAQALKTSLSSVPTTSGKKRSVSEIAEVEDVPMETDDVKEPPATAKDPSVVGDAQEEFDVDDDADEDVELPEVQIAIVDPEAAKKFKEKVKSAQQKKLDEYAKNVEDKVRLHERGWKDRYYTDKCKADDVENHGGREHLFRSYVVGLCWVMKYYYAGCPSWKWYYPFHYAPFASDLRNIERFSQDCKSFELNTPFNPVEQLMAVLPSDSSHAVPKASQWLMCDAESPIIDFYPHDVPVDPNGKAMPWLWVVLLPFIDEERLFGAFSPTMTKWSSEELLCNARGLDDGYLYVHRVNELSAKFAGILQDEKGAAAKKVKLFGCQGFSGSVRPPLSNEVYPVDDTIVIDPPPAADMIDQPDSIFGERIGKNEAVCVAFSEPARLSHKSVILPGAVLAKESLGNSDKVIRRPQLNRGGGTIANLGAANALSHRPGYGSMNISSYDRELAQRNGRGDEMYRPGNRPWGAMEPVPKRRNIPPEVANPFTNYHSGPHPNNGRGGGHRSQPHSQHYNQSNQHQRNYQNGPPPNQHWAGQQQQPRNQQSYPPPPRYQQNSPYQQDSSQQSSHQGHQNYHQGHDQQHRHQGQRFRGQSQGGRNHRQNPPQLPQQGYNFRDHNQGGNNGNSRVNPNVMDSLRAQLSSTLNRNRGRRDNRRP